MKAINLSLGAGGKLSDDEKLPFIGLLDIFGEDLLQVMNHFPGKLRRRLFSSEDSSPDFSCAVFIPVIFRMTGFENFGSKNNLEQLLINFANESLQGDFNRQVHTFFLAVFSFFVPFLCVCVGSPSAF